MVKRGRDVLSHLESSHESLSFLSWSFDF